MKKYEDGDLRVFWIPQVGMDGCFYVDVKTASEAILLINSLANYDLFQYENKIKPDYANCGGLEVFENGEWVEWINDDGDTIDELISKEIVVDFGGD